MSEVGVRSFDPGTDAAWAEDLLARTLAGRFQARPGELVDVLDGPGLVGLLGDRAVGLVTWFVGDGPPSGDADAAEIRVLVVEPDSRAVGVGGALLQGAVEALAAAGVRRAWLVTTNDNLAALGFYQRRGWRLAELHAGAVDRARLTMKPSIPEVGANGIPLRDELVLELDLRGS